MTTRPATFTACWSSRRRSRRRCRRRAPTPPRAALRSGRNHLPGDEDQEADETAYERSVDADVLQILADLEFQSLDEGDAVPIVHHLLDIGADRGAARQ